MGDTPLHVASGAHCIFHYNNDKIIQALLNGGADVNITNKVST